MNEFKVGDMVRVSGNTFFSGGRYSGYPGLPPSQYITLFDRVGTVEEIGEHWLKIKYLNTDNSGMFAPYQLEKLANISPE